MHTFRLKARNKGTITAVVVIFLSLLLLASWLLGAFEEIDLHSHAEVASEYVMQFFNKPGNITEEVGVAPKVIPPDAVRIYIGIVRLSRSRKLTRFR
jgi:Na+-transporting methylmalonyl-CoA/oxaloacetate decarboxylase gamma subunit